MKKSIPNGCWSQYTSIDQMTKEDAVKTDVKEAMKIAFCIAGGAFCGFWMTVIAFTF